MHYHLWLKPAGMLYDRLAELMNDLRREYRGPVFDPHVTLLGEMEGDEGDFCKKAEVLVQHLHALEIRLCAPGYEEDFFRCLYFSVDNTPALREAHQRAKQNFGHIPPSGFYPHVSLLYGLFSSRVKKNMIQSLPQDLPPSGKANEIVLIRAESTNPKDWHPVQIWRLLEAAEGKRA